MFFMENPARGSHSTNTPRDDLHSRLDLILTSDHHRNVGKVMIDPGQATHILHVHVGHLGQTHDHSLAIHNGLRVSRRLGSASARALHITCFGCSPLQIRQGESSPPTAARPPPTP